ncbi:subtilisin-like serine protease [Amycolatopsis mediterranei S699]|uniref:Subtilisin-like serine protease n=4 Tax=Amycolatopsis mediterranei TaxID=33910 RepID=A0A0H3D5B7_AMYMU|nr:S8 family serine peptidase [Amycolatopsis mediterranei]ADJ44733.1 subtilisin-like serine protease [Amycolatopsis mediterranei U32]AFO76443.1 subtilisin-like serine protease [Amycolatopsis mediterranei S699]AGT83572.1 subtilisin-like serine protease [Amycolatopsis mediterranei RB]KDO07443.1 serine protease [Amycolatopsis mediterranei]KDU91790.1 serine protease [Amycolatopsis mediterranei]
MHRRQLALAVVVVAGWSLPVPAAAEPAASPGDSGQSVTLITGDRVRVLPNFRGESTVTVEPGPGRDRIGFFRETHTPAKPGDITVVPSDALALVASGRLDPRLFDVSELLRQHLADSAGSLPLIVTSSAGSPAATPPATTAVRDLPSVRGTALRQDRRRGTEFWSWLTAGSALRAGVGKVWLDGLATPALDVSVPQIGAPAAWQAGYTGRGVTVGVLDTGVRADHPDLAGKVVEAQDFTGTRPDASDDLGHGTHVAGIIAGTGAASGGRYRGVAPDARLVSGKVCVAYGCPESAVIAGMEWIAPKVRVVNLSLGGDATDGTDPVSQAVNALTTRYGTLFVAAAGNDRSLDLPEPGPVVAPAAADAALAVGSVSAQDTTSPFSNRGARLGDYAVKPDIAAPGEGIVSARAAGTRDGDTAPVDDNYARLSGTSMATPHVAGSAALLLQRHPDWLAGRLKTTLTSTATPTADVTEQGAGRVDAGRAVSQQVTATTGSLGYGFVAWPRTQPVTKTVTYHNDTDAAVTLSLATNPQPLFTPSVPSVVVPAHGDADVGVTLRAGGDAAGQHGGRLTATAPGITVQTALGAFLEAESYDVSVRLIGRDGRFTAGVATLVDTATGAAFGVRPFRADGTAVVRVPKGRYDLNAFDISGDPAGQTSPAAVTLLSRPGQPVTGDVSITLDARAGKPLRAAVDRPDARLQGGELGLVSGNPGGTRTNTLAWIAQPGTELYAVGSDREVTDHTYALYFRATLAARPPGVDPNGYVYQLALLERGRVPADPVFRVRDRDLAVVDARYHTQGKPAESLRLDDVTFGFPGADSGTYQVVAQALPSRRTEYYTTGVSWQHLLAVYPDPLTDAESNYSYRTYRPGPQHSGWNRAPVGPAFGAPQDGWGVLRAGNQLTYAIPLVSGSDPEQYTAPPGGLTGTATLSRDGVAPASTPSPAFGALTIPDAAGTYTLRSVATRSVPWSVVGTAVDVAWTFHEPGAMAPAKPLPLLVVRAEGAVDDQSRAPAGKPFVLALTAQRQPGAGEFRLADLRVETSTDDGAKWTSTPTARIGNGGLAVVHDPPGGGFVSLRITARDTDGNAVTQTVIRAYQTTP